MRYLSSTCAHSGTWVSSLWPLKWKSPTSGTLTPTCSRRLRMAGTCLAASSVFTVMRTISEPARASAATWSAVDFASSVSVLVIDCTRMGASPPMTLSATLTGREMRRVCMGLLERETRDRHLGVRLERELAVVVEHLHVGRVADDDLKRGAARDLGLASGLVHPGQQHLAAAVADLDPRAALEAQRDGAGAGRARGRGRGCGRGWRVRRRDRDGQDIDGLDRARDACRRLGRCV